MATVAQIHLDQKDLYERWSLVPEDFWGDLKKETLLALQRLLETTMDIEVQDLIGARRWARARHSRVHRNGHYARTLLTGFGWINRLRVPRLRYASARFRTLPRYRRRGQDVDRLVLQMFLAGVSTRRVQEVLKPLFGDQTVSASLVSQISKSLDTHVRRFHDRPLPQAYRYLLLDGIYLKAKSPSSVRRRCVLVAYGIREDGVRELIDFRLSPQGESQAAWECFLSHLQTRGLSGSSLRLAIVDGNKGLWNALDFIFSGLPRQRCWAHKLRNALQHLPLRLRPSCKAQARKIYTASSASQALQAFKTWARFWRPIAPRTVLVLESDLEDLLRFFRCPKYLWSKLRTTNAIERAFREVRRRTRPMSCFQNTDSVERIIFAIFTRMNHLWENQPLWQITHNS